MKMEQNAYKYKSKHPKKELTIRISKNGEKIDLKYFSHLGNDEKTKKFYYHLVSAFCNKNYVSETECKNGATRCAITNLPIYGTCVISSISDIVLSKEVYEVFIRHLMSRCFKSPSIKKIVQETKRTVLIDQISEFLGVSPAELSYDILSNYSSQDCKKVEKMLHLKDKTTQNQNYSNGRVKAAFDLLLKGPIPIKEDEVVSLDLPLLFENYIPWPNKVKNVRTSSTKNTLGDLFGDKLAKLKNA